MIDCDALQFDLPLYLDDGVEPDVRSAIDAHLVQCPLCRQKLDDFKLLRVSFTKLVRPQIPPDIFASVRNAVAAKIAPFVYPSPEFHLLEAKRRWVDVWLMPYAVAGFTSIVLGIFMLWTVIFTTREIGSARFASENMPPAGGTVYLASAAPGLGAFDISPGEYASSRMGFTSESPSLNPQGALVALTRSLVRGEMRDDEVTVVADIFGNGLATISEVVEPSRDKKAVEELQEALQTDPSFAPFVPANMDHRSETVRVVLKIQNVNVAVR
jgi:hypothetical protein